MNPNSYSELLKSFIDAGYKFVKFGNEHYNSEREVILRHDVDFDVTCALESAKIESELGIRSTYFFLCRTNFYNLFDVETIRKVNEIKSLGHQISIHFDASLYEDLKSGLQEEVTYFERLFSTRVEMISFHRPAQQILDNPDQLLSIGIENTYMNKYFKKMSYFSDSTGVWRFGHPVLSDCFKKRGTLQLLTHPIWWFTNGDTNIEKLKIYYKDRVVRLKGDFETNCKPFRKISKDV